MKKLILCAVFITASFTSIAQVGIGTPTPAGVLDVVSTNSGVILPRVANIAAVTSPVNGMIIYDKSTNCIKVYENDVWTPCLSTRSINNHNQVVSSTGKVWMDRNLGAENVAASSTDFTGYGSLFQWGRAADGHQVIVRDAATPANGTAPSAGSSITAANPVESGNEAATFIIGSVDWLITQDDVRWSTGTEIAPLKTVNDPCPSGYRIPTETELDNERSSWTVNTSVGAFNSPLKLPLAGLRNYNDGMLFEVGTIGSYWSSTVSGVYARSLAFKSSLANMSNGTRAHGFSVRCIKD